MAPTWPLELLIIYAEPRNSYHLVQWKSEILTHTIQNKKTEIVSPFTVNEQQPKQNKIRDCWVVCGDA